MGKIVSVQNTIARLPGASNLVARFAGMPMGDVDYIAKMQGLFGDLLIGYWPGAEASNGVALDYSRRGFNGAYTGVTLGQPGIGDGLTCPLYDGANDFNNIYSAGFAAAFNLSEGTLGLWAKVNAAGVWTDAVARALFSISNAASTNLIRITKTSTNNQLNFLGNGSSVNLTTAGPIDWFHVMLTWSASANQLKAYFNGVQVGTTQPYTALSDISSTRSCIGSRTTVPNDPWSGNLAHAPVLNRVATPAEVAAAAVI